jgi:large subunit ribosomal protein L28
MNGHLDRIFSGAVSGLAAGARGRACWPRLSAAGRLARVQAGSSDILRRLARPCPESATHLAITQWSDPVASVCDVCGKGPGFGNNVSHSHRRTPRRWNPNIQRVRAMVGKTPRRLNVCTSCIKAGKVTR